MSNKCPCGREAYWTQNNLFACWLHSSTIDSRPLIPLRNKETGRVFVAGSLVPATELRSVFPIAEESFLSVVQFIRNNILDKKTLLVYVVNKPYELSFLVENNDACITKTAWEIVDNWLIGGKLEVKDE